MMMLMMVVVVVVKIKIHGVLDLEAPYFEIDLASDELLNMMGNIAKTCCGKK